MDMENSINPKNLFKILNPCLDPVFKSIFTKDAPESKHALRGLVSAIIQKDVTVVDVTTNEPPILDTADKQIRYDINCVMDNGEKANVEMTIWPDVYEAYRMEYYLARLHTMQEIKGKEKGYQKLKQSCQISIFAKANVFNDSNFFHKFIYHDPIRGIDLGGQTAIFTVELQKLLEILSKPVNEMTRLEMWAVFFCYYTDLNKQGLIQQILETDEEIHMAQAMMQRITAAEVAALKQLSRDRYEIDKCSHEYELDLREERGLAKGLAKGIEQGRIEAAHHMKEDGVPLEQISRWTNIPLEILTTL